MFVETLKASVVVKSLVTLLISALTALLIKKVVEVEPHGDNFPHVFLKH